MLRLLGLLREQLVYWWEGIDVKEGEQAGRRFSLINTDNQILNLRKSAKIYGQYS